MSRRKSTFENVKFFTRRMLRKYKTTTGVLLDKNQKNLTKSEINDNEKSFRRKEPGNGLISTQQIPVDNDLFQNNTFFGSAEVKVNVAFDKIINSYPFDGSLKQIEEFEDNLSSLEKNILNKFPKNVGFLNFDSSLEQYITVKDKAGNFSQSLLKGESGKSHINPKTNSFSIECFLRVPNESNQNSFILHSVHPTLNTGYAVFLNESNSESACNINFAILSGSSNYASASHSIEKGKWHNLIFEYDNRTEFQTLKIMSGSKDLSVSSYFNYPGLDNGNQDLVIGDGLRLQAGALDFNKSTTFSGSLDELRIFHGMRNKEDIDYYSRKNIFAHSALKVYFKFNEPTGSHQNNNLVLDHSGNSLHSQIQNYTESMRYPREVENPMFLEDPNFNPILFPSFPDVQKLNSELLEEANIYDTNNPNIITKLIPNHYLQEGAYFEGKNLGSESVENYNSYSNTPKSGKMGHAQLISMFLYFVAEELDNYKMYIDQVSQFLHPDYLGKDGVADNFLPDLAKYYGFELPKIFGDVALEQYTGRENLGLEYSIYEKSLLEVQNIIWRRVLKNLSHIFKSKGTKYALESIFRSAGIEPGRLFRLVEYNGVKEFRLGSSRQKITEMSTMLNFSGSLNKISISSREDGTIIDWPTLITAPLSGSRIEPGFPEIAGGNVLSTGTIKFHSSDFSAIPAEDTEVTIQDAYNKSVTFKFVNSSVVNLPDEKIGINRRDDLDQNKTTMQLVSDMKSAIESQFPNSFNIKTKNSEPGANLDLIELTTKDFSRKNLGNHTITMSPSDPNLTLSGFSGGNGMVRAGTEGYEYSGISATENDGLFTSGSWTVEGIYKFSSVLPQEDKRSLSRIVTQGVTEGGFFKGKHAVLSNLVLSPFGDQLTLFVRSSQTNAAPVLKTVLTGASCLNGKKWYIAYGRRRNDDLGQPVSSSYFIRAASLDYDNISSFIVTGSLFDEGDPHDNMFQNIKHESENYMPHQILIGSQSMVDSVANSMFLNDAAELGLVPSDARITYFDGKVGHIRFWSKYLTETESLEHARNFKSVGVDNPLVNNTFSITRSGSFQKLRLNVSTDQQAKETNSSGEIDFLDFSQNFTIKNEDDVARGVYTSVSGAFGFGFEGNRKVVDGERFDYTIISPFFDEYLDSDKIKIAGFSDGPNIKLYNSKISPVTEILPFEKEVNDNRFEIQVHLQRGLDEDIMNIFSAIDSLDDALGKPELMFSQEYPDLRNMRNLYFNRLTDKVNYRNFFDLFRWLDDAFSDMVEKLVPRNNNFLGINLIIESHALERYKIAYGHQEIYKGEDERGKLRSKILVSQRSGVLRRF